MDRFVGSKPYRPKLASLPADLAEGPPFDHVPASTGVDAVTLADIWLVMARRRTVVAAMLGASIAIGMAYTLFAPRLYAYTTIIEIGARYVGSRTHVGGQQVDLIEPPETVRAKITNGYIAQVLQEHFKNSPNDEATYNIKADVPKNSQILILSSKDAADKETVYAQLHNAVVDRIQQDHQRVVDVLKDDLEVRLKMRERGLADLRSQAKLFEAQLKRFENERDMPVKEMTYLTSLRLADNQRAQSEMLAQIDGIRVQLANMRETRTAVSPMRSLEPVGLGKKTMVALSALIGIFLAIAVAFVVDFAARTREEAVRRTKTA